MTGEKPRSLFLHLRSEETHRLPPGRSQQFRARLTPGKQQAPNSCALRSSEAARVAEALWGYLASDRRGRDTAHSAHPGATRARLPERSRACPARPAPTRSGSRPPGRDSPVRPRGLRRAARPSLPLAGRGMRLRGRCLGTIKPWFFKRGFATGLHFPETITGSRSSRAKVSKGGGNAGKWSLRVRRGAEGNMVLRNFWLY